MRLSFIIFLFLFSMPMFAEEEAEATQVDERILEDPQFKDKVEECKKTTPNDVGGCVQTAFNTLSPAIKTELQEKYIEQKVKKNQLTNYQQVRPISKETLQSPQFKALTDYLKTKLQEAMYGTDEKNLKVVDHGSYYQLYTSQMSKNIVLNLSSFCLDARSTLVQLEDTSGTVVLSHYYFYMVEADARDPTTSTRNKNIADLGSFKTINGEKQNIAKIKWESCISQISKLCKDEPKDVTSSSVNAVEPFASFMNSNPGTSLHQIIHFDPPYITLTTDDKEYTQNRACLVTNILKEQKLVLSANNKITTALKKQMDITSQNIANDNFNYDKLTTVTSGEMKDNYSDKAKETIDELEECKNTPDSQKCKDLLKQLVGDKDDLENSHTEYMVLSSQRNDKLEADLADVEKQKQIILIENNLEQDDMTQIEALDSTKIAEITSNIEVTYENEAQAIQDEIQKQIKKANDTNLVQLHEVKKEIEASQTSKTALMHYNNIVSGYLSASDSNPSGTSSTSPSRNNLQLIKSELDDSAYAEDRSPATTGNSSIDQVRLDNIKNGTDFSKISNTDGQTTTSIGIDDINQTLLQFNEAQRREED